VDFQDRLKENLEGLSYTPPKIRIGLFDKDRNSISIKPIPSSGIGRYIKGKTYNYSFQLNVHYESNYTAYETIMKLYKHLEEVALKEIISKDNSFALINIECTTVPNFVQETEYGTLYTAIFNAELYIQGGR